METVDRFHPPRLRVRKLTLSLTLALGASAASVASSLPADYANLRVPSALAAKTFVASPRVVPVTNCSDSGPNSLRAALSTAQDGDQITLACSTITLDTGLTINVDNLSITGADDEFAAIAPAPGKQIRLIGHYGSGNLLLTRVNLSGGKITGGVGGACVYSQGSVQVYLGTVSNCYSSSSQGSVYGGALRAQNVVLQFAVLSDNVAKNTNAQTQSNGGGAWAANKLSLSYSTVDHNQAMSAANASNPSKGGGVYAGANINVRNSTISVNHAQYGGGIATALSSPSTIHRSTISGNNADKNGGALWTGEGRSTLYVSSSTVAYNIADGTTLNSSGGAVFYTGEIIFTSSIVSGNRAGSGLYTSLSGSVGRVNGYNNLIGSTSSSIQVPGDTIFSNAPKLGPLANNGGRTMTHALLTRSLAVDKGIDTNLSNELYDQRGGGFPKQSGKAVDIGAYELQVLFSDNFEK